MKMITYLLSILMFFLNISCINKGNHITSKQVDPVNSIRNNSQCVVTNVYEGEAGRDIFYDTPEKKGILLISDRNFQFTILDKTDNNQWIIVEKAPVIVDESSVETEHLLFNIPKSKEINISNVDSSLSPNVSRFEKKRGVEYVVTSTRIGENEVYLPLKSLLPLITLRFGTNDDQIGQGVFEKKVNDGDYLYAIPSIAVSDSKIYVVDAINFRVIVFDYDGNYLGKINYPRKSANHKWNVVKDICVEKGIVYLLSTSEKSIYVIDAENEDVIYIINGKDTENKKFGSVNRLALDPQGCLLIPDTWDNSLYTYCRSGNEFKMTSKKSYVSESQLINDVGGLSYSIKSDSSKVSIYSSSGKIIGNFTYSLTAGGSNILGVDSDRNIYIRTFESDIPEAQFSQASYIKVMSQTGALLNNFKVAPWSGGPITKDVAIDGKGNIFIASFNSPNAESSEEPPSELNIRKICK